MILVDSSVWIDYFRGLNNPATDLLDKLLDQTPLAVGDLILAEVLQGFQDETAFRTAKKLLTSLEVVELGGTDIALKAAQNYRVLRRHGVTIRKTIDTIIATWCIESGSELLHNDKDFEPFVKHLGLRVVV